jgi:hypothetical protein
MGATTAANAQGSTGQLLTKPSQGINAAGNQTMASTATSDLIRYSNPNLGFALEYPST